MIPKRIEGTTRYLGAPVGWSPEVTGDCAHLAIKQETDPPRMSSAWEPTPDELARLAAGAHVVLTVAGSGHPPVILSVGEVPQL